jgi:voltage-gated potassium channel
MKFLGSILATFLSEQQMRRNVRALAKYLLFLAGVATLFSVLFHVIMLHWEGQRYSWVTGFYWTLTVMSTLGFGDITFHTDLGRVFSMVVLLSGIVLLLVVLPFTFIRYFYAPWLESQLRLRVPREVPYGVRDHVVMCRFDSIAQGLADKLKASDIPYFVIEPDPAVASRRIGEGISTVTGEVESRVTYDRLQVARARLLLANLGDAANTNIVLTVREVAPDVPIAAIAEEDDSVDILELSGCNHVLSLKRRLGEHLASRMSGGRERAHVIGRFRGLLVAEFPVHGTPLEGKRIRETKLRESTGMSVVGIWDRGRLQPVDAQRLILDTNVLVIVGTQDQMKRLDDVVASYREDHNPVLVIGGGKVGCAVAEALRRKEIAVHLIERNERLHKRLVYAADHVFIGDAADRSVLMSAGLARAPSVILTTNDDATNIYLTVYCRRLNPDLRIVCRVTHERNVDAMYRAGADVVLSYASLGVELLFSLIQGREPIMLGEGWEFFAREVPASLLSKTIAESEIGARTGVIVVAVEREGKTVASPVSSTKLTEGTQLIMLGTNDQRQAFQDTFR